MNNYEKIKAIINSWHLALCKIKNWGYIIYSSTTSDWSVRCSAHMEAIDECMNSLWINSDCEREIRSDIEMIKPLPRKVPKFKVWDLVEILDVNSGLWSRDKIEMIWKWPFKVLGKAYGGYNWYFVYNKDKTDFHLFDFTALCLWTWDEKVESITIWWVEYNKAEFERAVKNLKPLK